MLEVKEVEQGAGGSDAVVAVAVVKETAREAEVSAGGSGAVEGAELEGAEQ